MMQLEKILDAIPKESGVYLMKNQFNSILYVGKAKNLYTRVRQYFIPGRDGREMVPYLTSQVTSIETIITPSEKEALLLESTLIKEHQPKYNVLLKDDKTFVFLRLSDHPYPLLELIRFKERPKDKGTYFGPYTSAYSARQTLELMQRLFPLRQCSDSEMLRRKRPCLLYHIKRCSAPCVQLITQPTYNQYVEKSIAFLKGKDRTVLKQVEKERDQAAQDLHFEKAHALHKKIGMIERVLEEHQALVHNAEGDEDVFDLLRIQDEVHLIRLPFREGKLIGMDTYHIKQTPQSDADLWESFLLQHQDLAKHLILPLELPNKKALEEHLGVKLTHPQRGKKLKLLEMARANLVAHQNREDVLLDMQETLHLNRLPVHIECFDTSNISGSDPVASLVSYREGAYEKKGTRLFKIRDRSDDYSALREVLLRHYTKALEKEALPDLCIVDGGIGQLNVAAQVFNQLEIATVDLISVAKEEAKHTKGLTKERIFLPHEREPITLSAHSSILLLLQRVRDEAHRVAIGFHRERRVKRTLHSRLDDVPGIGPKKRRSLLTHFGSTAAIISASEEALLKVPGITRKDVDNIRKHLM